MVMKKFHIKLLPTLICCVCLLVVSMIFIEYWQAAGAGFKSSVLVLEPSSLLLMCIGLVGLMVSRRKLA